MATSDSSGHNPSGNPPIVDIEAVHVGVWPEFDLNAVELEVTDQDGEGFRTLLAWEQGMDLALRIAVARLRGIATTRKLSSSRKGPSSGAAPFFVAATVPCSRAAS
jgi:hypothetical protein